jgi:hypothetical protein
MKLIRHLFLILLLATLHGAVSPQETTIDINYSRSNTDIFFGSTSVYKIFGHDSVNYWVIKFFGNQYHLEKLDKDLNFIKSEPLKLYEGLRTFDPEYFVNFYDKLYVFTTRRGLTDITLYYQEIDKNTLKPVSAFNELTRLDIIRGNWADFHFSLSRNRTKLLVAARTKMNWTGVQFNEFYVFGKDLALEWTNKDSYEFQGQGPRDNKYLVDEQGNVSVLSLLKRESILSLFSDVRNLYKIYRYTDKGQTFKEYPVTLNDKYIRGLDIIAGLNGELICGGLYSETFRTGMRGTFFFKIDPVTGTVYSNVLNPFDDSLMETLGTMDEPTIKSNSELIEYIITDFVLRKNGNVILIAEQFFDQIYNTYNNLIITCFDPNGTVYWNRALSKNQDFNPNLITYDIEPYEYRQFVMETGVMDISARNLCSYALMAPIDKSEITLFYNDDIRNMGKEVAAKNFSQPRKSYIAAVHIDEFGNIVKQPLLKWEKRQQFPEPLRFYDTLYDTIIIPSFRERKMSYYKITASF